ncbi:MAG: hypothetical protein HUJ25_16725 [Crocinitomicaceae bacterium]|nr:hypothetical protein [Crocinitomicaceae bacterium]
MNPYLRNALVIMGGLFLGSLVNGGIVSISSSMVEVPAGVDFEDMDSYKAHIKEFSGKYFAIIFLAHALGTLVAAYFVARLVTKAPAFFGFMMGVIFLLGGLYMAWILPAPLWFEALDLLGAYLPMALIGNVLARRKRSDW